MTIESISNTEISSIAVPRALFLYTRNKDDGYVTTIKKVLEGTSSCVAGTLSQELMDNTFPALAPYGGYVAYGFFSAGTEYATNQMCEQTTNCIQDIRRRLNK